MKHTDKENTGQAMGEGNPNGANDLRKAIQSDADLAEMLVGVAEAAQADAIICAAAAATKHTAATAIVVSATDGNVRIFSEGRLVMELDPNVPHGPITLDD